MLYEDGVELRWTQKTDTIHESRITNHVPYD
jgi:hypothetical protein